MPSIKDLFISLFLPSLLLTAPTFAHNATLVTPTSDQKASQASQAGDATVKGRRSETAAPRVTTIDVEP